MIIDPGNHYHKDDMADEPEIPGLTYPEYDEHWGNYYDPSVSTDYNPDDVPF